MVIVGWNSSPLVIVGVGSLALVVGVDSLALIHQRWSSFSGIRRRRGICHRWGGFAGDGRRW